MDMLVFFMISNCFLLLLRWKIIHRYFRVFNSSIKSGIFKAIGYYFFLFQDTLDVEKQNAICEFLLETVCGHDYFTK